LNGQNTTKDVLKHVPLHQIKIEGYLGTKINQSISNRILQQDVPEIIEPFVSRKDTYLWRSEFWGKWFTSAVSAYEYTLDPELKIKIDEAIKLLMKTQSADGYIGCYADSARFGVWDVWGIKYTLLGMLAYHKITNDEKVLASAEKLADYLMANVGPGKRDIIKLSLYRGMPASSVLEAMVILYERTKNKRYLDFSLYIVERWSSPEGPQLIEKAIDGSPVLLWLPCEKEKLGYWEDGYKAYEMISCFEGLCLLYKTTGTPIYLEACIKFYENLRDNEMMVVGSGSAFERWYGGHTKQTEPAKDVMESCTAMLWEKFCYQLLLITGNPMYADEIEKTTYNALLGSMKTDGSWWTRHNPMMGERDPEPRQQCEMNQNCCVANGPRVIMLQPELATMMGASGPVINLYSSGIYRVNLTSGTPVKIAQKTSYPAEGSVKVAISIDKPELFVLSLRIPAWSNQTLLKVNGKPVQGIKPGTYVTLSRIWKNGDKLELNLDMRGKVVEAPGSSGQYAVVRGPIVLAFDKRISETDELMLNANIKTGDYIDLKKVKDPSNQIWMVYDVPLIDKDGQVKNTKMCDFSSAGNTWTKESTYKVWVHKK